jgi:hypothetical protein
VRTLFGCLSLLLALASPAGALGQELQVIAVRPSGDTVPENLLRLSIVFDRPTGDPVLPGFRLSRTDGGDIERPFLDEELWSPDGTILTILFNPGRVKTGIDLHERYGRALHSGARVKLSLDGRVIKEWQVVKPETRPIDPGLWRLTAPESGTNVPLVVSMGRPTDAMEVDVPVVLDASGKVLLGRSVLSADESIWTFTPDDTWKAGRYILVLPAALEDPEGNTIAAPFEASSSQLPLRSNTPTQLSVTVR